MTQKFISIKYLKKQKSKHNKIFSYYIYIYEIVY